eukprot:scaffold8352_cov170-Ochromonas_danica.AAC.3
MSSARLATFAPTFYAGSLSFDAFLDLMLIRSDLGSSDRLTVRLALADAMNTSVDYVSIVGTNQASGLKTVAVNLVNVTVESSITLPLSAFPSFSDDAHALYSNMTHILQAAQGDGTLQEAIATTAVKLQAPAFIDLQNKTVVATVVRLAFSKASIIFPPSLAPTKHPDSAHAKAEWLSFDRIGLYVILPACAVVVVAMITTYALLIRRRGHNTLDSLSIEIELEPLGERHVLEVKDINEIVELDSVYYETQL